MEEMLPSLKAMLKESIALTFEKETRLISMEIKKEVKGKIADKEEIIIMLKMFGGLREDIPMRINIEDRSQKINIAFDTDEDFEKIREIFINLWDNTVELLEKTIQGDFKQITDIPNVDD